MCKKFYTSLENDSCQCFDKNEINRKRSEINKEQEKIRIVKGCVKNFTY